MSQDKLSWALTIFKYFDIRGLGGPRASLVQLSTKGKPVIGLLLLIPAELNALLQKLDMLSLFARPPKWAMQKE
ncbi:hypothetical protein IT6_03170 [Methylacidiphilum caldifontis]|uniref:hypothetical protein n=1 Tax=Methylacidiphilum caldifontis TaxID=2795386 RepID=UPI001A8D544C|nr:hypothetical protein [Methylacidiphilum caldifontis]QSR89298.1 hypothetical protein IT6_03170 [Methylacidiphilum caldifontis]